LRVGSKQQQKMLFWYSNDFYKGRRTAVVLKEDKERSNILCAVSRTCKLAYIFLRILLVITVLAWLLPFLLGLLHLMFPHVFTWLDSLVISAPFDLLVSGLLSAVFIGIVTLILRDISKGETPFTRKQSKRIRLIAYLTFAQVILELLFSMVATALYPDGLVILGYYHIPESSALTMYLDLQALIFAIICYCISLAFEYGVLLQRDSDDFV
jgi:hypothetical protein